MNLLRALDFKNMEKERIEAITHQMLNHDGGEGSGNFGHKGRPGQVGGSSEGGGAKADSGTQKQHKKAVDILRGSDYDDGTYDVGTLKPVDFNDGYQVTFCQIGDNYSDEEYAQLVNEFYKYSTDGKSYAGKFQSEPEISFHFGNLEDAVRMGKKYNQISVWDWANANEISTGGTGRRR